MKDYTLRIINGGILLIILVLTIIFRYQFNGGEYLQVIGFIIGAIGATLIITGITTLGKYFTASMTPKGLVTHGIYSKIHHPIFMGVIMIYLGLELIFQSIYGLLLVFFVLVPFYIYSAIEEEKILSKMFKDEYMAYKKKTLF
jgi:protein-S-isoprenylcysteine O-methyltransferase Ste14